jgi:hypothetical protein
MAATEFNKKYKAYLEEGHYGLAIDDEAVINYLDGKFQEFIKIPGFSYSQIKLKFGMARVYCQPTNIPTNELEAEIEKILKDGK